MSSEDSDNQPSSPDSLSSSDICDQIMADRRFAEALLDSDTRFEDPELPPSLRDSDWDGVEIISSNRCLSTTSLRCFPRASQADISISDQLDDYDDEDDKKEAEFNMHMMQGTLRVWIMRDEMRCIIANKFEDFLLTYVQPMNKKGGTKYVRLINEMVLANKCSLEVDYNELTNTHSDIAICLCAAPKYVLEVMEEVTKKVIFDVYPDYKNHQNIFVRVTNLQVDDEIRQLCEVHLNTMIHITGVVSRRSGVIPRLQQMIHYCYKCGTILGHVKIRSCPKCKSEVPLNISFGHTTYKNYQKLTIQESPETVRAGRVPRHKEVILLNDLIDCALPGEEIEVTGIYTNNFDITFDTKKGCPVFGTVVEANYVRKKQDVCFADMLTWEDKRKIEELSKDPRIVKRIIKSIAPSSVYLHEDIKIAIALAMFGGQEKNIEGKHRIRGDINVLLLGDLGTAKSELLKYVGKRVQKAVYTTGKGASAVGLTAAVHKDPVTRDWTLEGGALVLADGGICLIDEFDEMNDQDRVRIHDAMEQQSISISMAGVVTSLQARCSVIAIANPVGERYDSSKSFAQNVELTDPIISGFDILCVVKDVVDNPVTDEMPVEAQDGIQGSSSSSNPEVLSKSLLKNYITYSKNYVFPKLSEIDAKKLETVYADLREAMNGQGASIETRHLESMIRISEAHARMHFRQYVTEVDVNIAIRVVLHSFISTQNFKVQRTLREVLGQTKHSFFI